MSVSTVDVLRAQKALAKPLSSPERTFPKPSETEDRPGFIANSHGTRWAGMMRGNAIVENGGETYGDTDISLDNSDTRARVDRAKQVLAEKPFYELSFTDQMILMDMFARRIHQPDVVGAYFPAVQKVKAQQDSLIAEGQGRVLSEAQKAAIQDLRKSQVTQNTANWSRRDDKGVVEDDAVIAVEETNTETTLAVLQIEKEAAYEVLGDRAAKIEAEARKDIDGLSEVDLERRVTASLMDEAGKAKLTADEQTKLEGLKAEEDRLWDEKHANQSDFADAIRDGNPDCSEYASLTAVSLAESGIKNMRVMGHVLHDDDFPQVGAHAYNVILDQSGQNVIGVFEGTATSGTFKQVMNNVSLKEFENGTTLVTHSPEGGWSTYGTGAPAQGRDLDEFVYDAKTDSGYFIRDIVESADVSAIAEAKMAYTQNLNPSAVADQIIGIYEQYGDGVKVQAWIDDIRDGMIPGDDTNPALAQAAQILQDYNGTMPHPNNIRDRITDIVRDAQERALANNDYDLAITPEVLQRLDGPASASLAADIKETLDGLSPDQIATLSDEKPWLAQVAALSAQIGDVQYGYSGSGKSAFDYAREGDSSYLDAYGQIASIVRNQDISSDDLQDLQQAAYDQNATLTSDRTLPNAPAAGN